MSQFLLIERIKVQNANAASGFTWGFPSITHFLGFSHNLQRKLSKVLALEAINLKGCVVIAHGQNVLTYKESSNIRFSQYKTAQYLGLKFDKGILKDPAINEEAKMNMTVSLLIPINGYLGDIQEKLVEFIENACKLQRLAGGTILNIENVDIVDFSDFDQIKRTKNKLLPGFVLQDRSAYLEQHYLNLKKFDPHIELLDAWFDFITLKQVARPICDLIDRHLDHLAEESEEFFSLNELWLEHKSQPYQKNELPVELIEYFQDRKSQINSKIVAQWKDYLNPTDKTSAVWEYVKKPETGFLVPIMNGYTAITEVFTAGEIEGARDSKTDLCFVEAVHSIGEWQSVHRLKTLEQWQTSVWNYAPYENDWYLCKQNIVELVTKTDVEPDPYS